MIITNEHTAPRLKLKSVVAIGTHCVFTRSEALHLWEYIEEIERQRTEYKDNLSRLEYPDTSGQ